MKVLFNFLNANTMLLQILFKLLLISLIVIALTLMAKKLRWLKIYGIVLVAAMCGLFYASRLPQAPCLDSAVLAETQNLSGAQIVRYIFEQQLVWQQSKRPLAAGKITAYKIEKVTSCQRQKMCILLFIPFNRMMTATKQVTGTLRLITGFITNLCMSACLNRQMVISWK